MLKNSPVYKFAASMCIILLSCGTMVPEKESWEGIYHNTLRVFVQYEYTDDFDGRINPETRELLLNSGRTRAEIILLSYLRLHVTAVDKLIACQQMIPGIAAAGTMRYINCGTDHCRIYIDYNVKDFLIAAGIHQLQ
jgi:hypothetical protein